MLRILFAIGLLCGLGISSAEAGCCKCFQPPPLKKMIKEPCCQKCHPPKRVGAGYLGPDPCEPQHCLKKR